MIVLDATSYVPPFEQVRSQFAQQIHDGTLPAGARLPTVRRLADDLGLAANTVARAYRELENAGLVSTQGRAGTTVAATNKTGRTLEQAAKRYADTVRRLGVDESVALAHVEAALRAGTRRVSP